MILASCGNDSLSPPHRLPLGIPMKIAKMKNSKHAGDDGKREEAREASLPPSHRAPHAAWSEITNLCNKQGSSSSSSLCDPLSFFRRTDQNRVRTESSIRSNLGPVSMDKSCQGYKGHSPSPATLGEPTFHTFSYKTWRTVYMKNKRLRSPGRSCSTYL